MRAAVCHATDRKLCVEERTLPDLADDEVRLRVQRCGICGSELHISDQAPRSFPGGLVFGHEYAGEIVELGSKVSGLAVGDLVALYPALGCGDCVACRRGNEILCPSARRLLGGFAEYAQIPAACAIRLPDGLTAEHGALVEPLAVACYGVKAAGLRGGERVLVLGAGSIALAAIFWARRSGAGRIAAISRSPGRAALALEFGADAYLTHDDATGLAETLGGPPDVIIECVGIAGMLERAVALAPTYGRIVSLGFGTAAEAVVPAQAGMKDLTIRFPVGYSRDHFREVMATMLTGPVDPARMVSRVISLEETPYRFARMLAGHSETKVQISP